MRATVCTAALAWVISATPIHASPYHNCDVLFVNAQPPTAPITVTPLCEDRDDAEYFATGYSKKDNRGDWSAYRLDQETAVQLIENPLPRPNVIFHQNPKLKGGGYVQPRHASYTGTGFDRGHLAPNGAMAWDEQAQRASFTVSNIAPQNPGMNRNIWRCFEQSTREWAETSGTTYVVVGTVRGSDTVSSDADPKHVAINVPTHYFAVVYRKKPAPVAIGVMVPNSEGHLDIRDFVMSVAELEQRTGFKFHLPTAVASTAPDLSKWPTRVVTHELLGKLPNIDEQCPRVDAH